MEHQKSSKIYRINRTSGAASTDGVDFENYMFLQVLLRLLENDTIEEFYIAQNVSDVLPFDDIVIRVKYNLPGSTGPASVTKLFLVQLKYIQTRGIPIEALTATDGKGPFQLQKYFVGYKSLLKKISHLKDEILQECKPEDMTFIILTNAPCPLGDDNYSINNLCRKLLETNKTESNVFQFDSSERYNKFYQQLKTNNNLIDKDLDGIKFLKQLVLFAGGSKISTVKENIIEKLKQHFSDKDINMDDVLQRAIKFISNSSFWLSGHSGSLFDVMLKYQGVPVKLTSILKLWDLPPCKKVETTNNTLCKNKKKQFINRIIVQNMCLDNPKDYVCVGKPMKTPVSYYVDRTPKKHNTGTLSTDKSIVLLCAGPGMGKSSYFTNEANLLKKRNPEKFVIRENLVDFSKFLRDVDVEEDERSTAVNFLLKISGTSTGTAKYDLFELCLQKSKEMVIFLDGVDEVSPHYYDKLLVIIQTIRKEFDVELWISTRPIVQARMEKDLGITSWTLEVFSRTQAMRFIAKYCGNSKVIIFKHLELKLKRVPIFCKMLGDIIKNNHLENINDITNEAELYDIFVDTMYEVYNQEKKKHDVSISATKRDLEKLKKIALEDHEKAALLEIFSERLISKFFCDIWNECNDFLEDISAGEEKAGLIVNILDGKPIFIHRTIAEYFCGRWFSKNLDKYHELVQDYNMQQQVNYYMSYKLKGSHELFKLILMSKEDEINEYLKNIDEELNIVDPLGRDLWYYVNQFSHFNDKTKYNIISKVKLRNEVHWKSIQYYSAKTRYMINLHLISSFVDSLKIENHLEHRSLISLIYIWLVKRNNRLYHHTKFSHYFYLKYCRHQPLHFEIINSSDIVLDIGSCLVKENINSKDDLGLTALHLAAAMDNFFAVKLLCECGAEYSNDNVLGVYPHQLIVHTNSQILEFLEETMSVIDGDDISKVIIITEDYVAQNLPLHDAVQKNDLDRVKKESDGFNRVDSRGRTALHVAAASHVADKEIFWFLFSKRICYTRDENGLFPHDYCHRNERFDNFKIYNSRYDKIYDLHRYGIARNLANLPENKQSIFGENFIEILTEIGPRYTYYNS